MDTTLSTKTCLRYGWETFKKRPWFFVGTTLLIGLVSAFIPNADIQDPWVQVVGIFIIATLLNTFLQLAGMSLALKAHDDVLGAHLKGLWRPDLYLTYLGASLLTMIVVVVGLVLLIIPGLILGVGLALTGYIVIDQKLSPVAAMKESWRLTKGHKWKLALLMIVLALLNILGMLLLLVGLLVTVPVSALALAHAYRLLSGTLVTPTPVEPVVVTVEPTVSAE